MAATVEGDAHDRVFRLLGIPALGPEVREAWMAFMEEIGRERAALRQIAETARWYAENGSRLPHEVDHALCVEILDFAEKALYP